MRRITLIYSVVTSILATAVSSVLQVQAEESQYGSRSEVRVPALVGDYYTLLMEPMPQPLFGNRLPVEVFFRKLPSSEARPDDRVKIERRVLMPIVHDILLAWQLNLYNRSKVNHWTQLDCFVREIPRLNAMNVTALDIESELHSTLRIENN